MKPEFSYLTFVILPVYMAILGVLPMSASGEAMAPASVDTPTSKNSGVNVPVLTDKVTIVLGHWMTVKSEGGGGVSVDPVFTDEIVIRF